MAMRSGPSLPVLLSALLASALPACETTRVSVVEVDASASDPSQRVDPDWPVTVPPGAVLTEIESRSDRLRYRLETELSVDHVYDRLHPELLSDGWRRRELERKKDEAVAQYRRRGVELDVKVKHDGRGRVRVEIELDD